MKLFKLLIITIAIFSASKLSAQGPPITADSPIMLGGNTVVLKNLTEIRNTKRGTFTRIPIIAEYIITSDLLLSVQIPYVSYSFNDEMEGGDGSTLGDINLIGKYQFYRKDQMGKTFRMAAKTFHNLPTGEKLDIPEMSTGHYAGGVGLVAAYESIKFGITSEVGYKWQPEGIYDRFQYKLGFGLPLLKPTYPVDQLNLYFEYNSELMVENDMYRLLYTQGIQYAKNKWTWEAGVQFPLIQNGPEEMDINYSIFLGTRFIL